MARWEATDSGGRAYHRPGASESQPQCSTNGLHRILFEGNGFELQVQRPCAAIGLAHSSPVGRRSSRVLRAVLCAAWVAEVLGAVSVPKSVIAHPLKDENRTTSPGPGPGAGRGCADEPQPSTCDGRLDGRFQRRHLLEGSSGRHLARSL